MHKASVELVENEEKRTQITNTAIVVRKLIQWLPNIISAVYAVWLVSRGAVSLGGLVGFILILSKFVDAYTGLPFAWWMPLREWSASTVWRRYCLRRRNPPARDARMQ